MNQDQLNLFNQLYLKVIDGIATAQEEKEFHKLFYMWKLTFDLTLINEECQAEAYSPETKH